MLNFFFFLKLIIRPGKSMGCYTNHKTVEFWLVVMFNQRGSATNGANLSIYIKYTAPALPSYSSFDTLQGGVVHHCQPTNPASPLHHASHGTGHPQALPPLYQLGNRLSLQGPLLENGIFIFHSYKKLWNFPISPLTSSQVKDNNDLIFFNPLF